MHAVTIQHRACTRALSVKEILRLGISVTIYTASAVLKLDKPLPNEKKDAPEAVGRGNVRLLESQDR